ncbi:TonB-dependent receptor [Aliidiomarina quisquiliarum]|uniref:TonB-dependent receptor n=1 Tax=Aliidiomarina quisquiliarum TaxID=2938947 RepID=UPI00208F0095|nr:TonB-dependent receptor [Aliidiomarina quisquiliarum]MCO4321088.1 TonB-dependent receptor [Aliidiomarina quisquiliarum]
MKKLTSNKTFTKKIPVALFVATSLSVGFISTVAFTATAAEDEQATAIERIVITGNFRPQGIEDVPASVSVLSSNDIQQRNAEHLEHALAMAPNVNLASGASRASFIQIRGVGERSQFVDPINPSVGLVIDGINYSSLGTAGTLFDIGQVEVFRGPQTTRFGADGMAGMIYLGSTPISDYRDGLAELTLANYNSYAGGVAATHRFNEAFSARLSVYQHVSDGFMENVFLNRKDTQNQDELTLRLNSHWRVSDHWDAFLTYHRFDIDNGYDAWSLDQDRTTLSDTPGRDTLDSHAGRVKLVYSGAEAYTAELSVSMLTADSIYEYDEDWAYEGIRPGWEYNSFDQYLRARDQWEVETRLLSATPINLFGNDTDWIVGVYWQQREQDLERNYGSKNGPFTSSYDTRNQAIYGELGQHLSQRLKASLGLRYERYSNTYSDSRSINATPEKAAWGGRASLEYALATTGSIFTSVAHGFKAGGVNGEALGRVEEKKLEQFRDFLESKAVFAPELLTTFEVGYRAFIPAQSLRFEATAFYSWRDDMQVSAYVEQAGVFVSYLDNASAGRNWGLEATLDYMPTDQLRWFASLGWLGSEYRHLMLQDGTNLTGREQAHAPNYQVHTGVEWQFNDALNLRVEVEAKDSFFFSNSHDQRAKAQQLVHLRLNYNWQNWQFSVFARNLFDQDYATRGFYFGNDPRDEYTAKNYVQYGEPSRVGVTARLRF